MSMIDLAPLVNQVVIPIITPVLLGVATWALTRVAKYAHFQVQDSQRKLVLDVVDNAVAYAEKMLAGKASVTVNDKVATAVNYILPKVPDALKAVGITPEHLAQIVTARLPK